MQSNHATGITKIVFHCSLLSALVSLSLFLFALFTSSLVVDDMVAVVMMTMVMAVMSPASSSSSPCILLRSLVVLFTLHSPVLEPDLDLPLCEVEIPCELPALLLGDVGVEQELLLQLQRLEL